jgi:ATP-binding cassette, subfamily B, multidrug efflux pump
MRGDFGYFEEQQLGKPYDIKLLGRLYPFVRPYALLLLGAVGLIVGITVLELALPYVTKTAIDRYIVPETGEARKTGRLKFRLDNEAARAVVDKNPHLFTLADTWASIPMADLAQLEQADILTLRGRDLDGIRRMTLIFLALIMASFFLNAVQLMLMEYTGQMVMHDLRMRLFTHIQGLAVSFFNRNPVGRLVTRTTNDVQNMNELFTSIIVFIFKDLFLLLGISAVLLIIDWRLALICFTVVPVIVLASVHFAVQARDVYRTLRIKVAEINTRFSETINGLKVIQLFRRERSNYDKFAELNHENYLAGMRQIHVFAIFMPIIEILSAVALAIIIYYGGHRVLAEHISLGTLVVFISYMRMFFRPIRDLAEKYNIMQNAMASAERIFLILDTQDHPPAARAKTSGTLDRIREVALEDVSFGYVPDRPVLKNVSFHIRAGETIAVVGPTGAGKTSLINLLLKFYVPVSGRIRVNGTDIRELDTSLLRSKIAIVTQDPFLFSKSIRENITEGNPRLTDEELDRVLDSARCRQLVDKLPEGVETILSEAGESISSGERQLISIARALARDPQMIILDEATSYIDSQTEHDIQKALANLMAGRTSIIVAHRLSTARGADRIIVLKDGAIIETGSHRDLMNREGFYYRLNRLQG